MSQNYLMRKPGEGQMYVPPAKLQEYEEAGWIIVERPESAQPKPSAAAVEEEVDTTADESAEKAGTRRSKKG